MWTCNLCDRTFKIPNQGHYCSDQTVKDFLKGKSPIALSLFEHFLRKTEELGPVKLHATKSMLIFSSTFKFAYVINLGKSFVDVVLIFDQPFFDNLCFRKIAQVPGTNDFNHHLRIMYPEDLNEEVMDYIKKAYNNGKKI
jgi:hypothetical protein